MASTDPQTIIDALDALALDLAQNGGTVSYSINGRTATFQSLEQISKLRSYYASLLQSSSADLAKPTRVQFQGGPK